MTLASVHKPKVHEHRKAEGDAGIAPAATAPTPPQPGEEVPAEAEAPQAGE
jgi:hypothetical protein